jgi:hypothetical protein
VGQNSTGGAIFVNSVRPTFERVTGFIQQTFGDYGYSQTQAAAHLPVSDHFAIRVAENIYRKDSFYTDLNVGNDPLTANLQPGNVSSQSAVLRSDGSRPLILTCTSSTKRPIEAATDLSPRTTALRQ